MINCACRGSPLRIAVAFARFNYWDSERARQLHCMAAPAGHAARTGGGGRTFSFSSLINDPDGRVMTVDNDVSRAISCQ